jgi:hypothetical protein
MKRVSGILIPVEGPVVPITVQSLDDYQSAVGGDIEALELSGGATMYLNDAGKLDGLPLNPRATQLSHLMPRDWIVGPVLILGPVDGNGDDTDLPDGWPASALS